MKSHLHGKLICHIVIQSPIRQREKFHRAVTGIKGRRLFLKDCRLKLGV